MPSRDRAMRELRAELDRYRAHHERCVHGCELHYEEQS